MEHVNAAYESIVGSPLQYERKTYLDGLQEAKRSVTKQEKALTVTHTCLLYTSPSPRDRQKSRMPSSA